MVPSDETGRNTPTSSLYLVFFATNDYLDHKHQANLYKHTILLSFLLQKRKIKEPTLLK